MTSSRRPIGWKMPMLLSLLAHVIAGSLLPLLPSAPEQSGLAVQTWESLPAEDEHDVTVMDIFDPAPAAAEIPSVAEVMTPVDPPHAGGDSSGTRKSTTPDP